MRKIIILAILVGASALAFGQDSSSAPADQPASAPEATGPATPDAAAVPDTSAPAEPEANSAAPDATAPTTPDAATAPAASPAPDTTAPAATTPDASSASPSPPSSGDHPEIAPAPDQAAILEEITRLSSKLEEANGIIDELRSESYDLKNRAQEAESKAQAAQAIAEASDAQRQAAEDAAARAEELASEADKLRAQVADLEKKIADLESGRDAMYGKLASFGSLKLDPAAFPDVLRSGFDGSQARLGTWKVAGGMLSQTDGKQYFSRLTFPLVQSSAPVLYSFETKASGKAWVGTGIHLFAEGVKKPKGYGEGKSLLVWLTRDAKVRGNDGTYLQVYRSDSDVSMERVLDAKVKERLDGWNRVDVLYEPAEEFIVIAVNGTVRAAYRTYFGIGAGATMSLRTLGEGVSFRNLEVRK